MSRARPASPPVEEARVRPLYVRVLRLRHFDPPAMVCFVLLEGSMAAALMLALAEWVSWWGLILIPMAVAFIVKINDVVAGMVARNADRVPQGEGERFQREARPAIGRASVPVHQPSVLGQPRAAPGPPGAAGPPSATGRPGTVYSSGGGYDQPRQNGSGRAAWQGQPPEWHESPERHDPSPEWHDRPEWRGQQPQWHGHLPEWRAQQPEWRGQQPAQQGQQPQWNGHQPDWRG